MVLYLRTRHTAFRRGLYPVRLHELRHGRDELDDPGRAFLVVAERTQNETETERHKVKTRNTRNWFARRFDRLSLAGQVDFLLGAFLITFVVSVGLALASTIVNIVAK